jgi:hypothetical protein
MARGQLLLPLALLLSACRGDGAPAVRVLSSADTVISDASEVLAVPVDLVVDPGGRLYVLDESLAQVVRLEPGGARTLLGRPGAGPGEFRAPRALDVRGDTVRVDDRGNRRVVVFDGAGSVTRTYSLPERLPGTAAFGPGGQMTVTTLGFTAAGLAQRLDPQGVPVLTYGELVAHASGFWNFTNMKADVRRGRVPNVLRNHAFPVMGQDGGSWLVLAAEGEVRRFDAAGRQLWTRRVSLPEVKRIREQFFAANRAEPNRAAFHALQIFVDAVAVGDALWVLVGNTDDEPSSVLVLSGDGTVSRRYQVPGLSGARSLAVDPQRRRLYLTSPSAAAVVSAQIPAEGGE